MGALRGTTVKGPNLPTQTHRQADPRGPTTNASNSPIALSPSVPRRPFGPPQVTSGIRRDLFPYLYSSEDAVGDQAEFTRFPARVVNTL